MLFKQLQFGKRAENPECYMAVQKLLNKRGGGYIKSRQNQEKAGTLSQDTCTGSCCLDSRSSRLMLGQCGAWTPSSSALSLSPLGSVWRETPAEAWSLTPEPENIRINSGCLSQSSGSFFCVGEIVSGPLNLLVESTEFALHVPLSPRTSAVLPMLSALLGS